MFGEDRNDDLYPSVDRMFVCIGLELRLDQFSWKPLRLDWEREVGRRLVVECD